MKHLFLLFCLSVAFVKTSAQADEHEFARFLREKLAGSSPNCYVELGQPPSFWYRSRPESSEIRKRHLIESLSNETVIFGKWNDSQDTYEYRFKKSEDSSMRYHVTSRFSRTPQGASLESIQLVPMFADFAPITGEELEPKRGEAQITCEF